MRQPSWVSRFIYGFIVGSASSCSGVPSTALCAGEAGAESNACTAAGTSSVGGTDIASGGTDIASGGRSTGGSLGNGGSSTAGHAGLVCATGQANCDGDSTNGCEANLNTDPLNCGTCSIRCPYNGGRCVAGMCIDGCGPGFADCDAKPSNGCEANLRRDLNHCGACGNVCAAVSGHDAMCTNGVCQLWSPYADCDKIAANGAETNLLLDPKNCGACGNACTLPVGAPVCNEGACTASE